MKTLRLILTALAVVVLLMASQSMAVARGQARDVSGTMVLCTGTGPVSVAFDSQGNPVGPVHICPDCALTLVMATSAPPPFPSIVARVRAAEYPDLVVAPETITSVVPTARGPPAVA